MTDSEARARPGWESLAHAGFFALLPVAAAAGALALAPLSSIAGLASARPSLIRSAWPPSLPVLLLFAFTGWVSLSAFWSSYADHSQAARLISTLALGLLFAAAAAASPAARRLTRAAGAASLVVLAALLAVEAFAGAPLNGAFQPDALPWQVRAAPGRGAVVLTALLWGVLGALMLRKSVWLVLALALAVASAVLSRQFDMQANVVAYVVGVFAFALAFAAPRAGLLIVSGVLGVWMLAAPFATPPLLARAPDTLPHSWAMRAEIWDFAAARIREAPWIGRGLDASRTFTDAVTYDGERTEAIPLHPHSASLQVWLETGLVGALLAAGALFAGGWRLARSLANNRAKAAAAAGAMAAIGFLANVSFGAWQEWWIATMLTAAALVGAIEPTLALLSPAAAPREKPV